MKSFVWKKSILFENDDYVIINKPPGISSVSDRAGDTNLLSIAGNYYEDIQIGHRLDKDTSGALAFAKSSESYRHLSLQFEHRKVKKRYHAICDGIHDFKKLRVNLPLYTTGKGIVKVDLRRGKESETILNTSKAFKKHTLVHCTPLTGRTHQIRVHLSIKDASISGDHKYGGEPIFLSQLKKNYNLKKIYRRISINKKNGLTFAPSGI